MKFENSNLKEGNSYMTKYEWEEFRETGLLQITNQFLHIFGWSIVLEIDDETNKVTNVYPARCGFRGFTEESNAAAYERVAQYMHDNAEELLAESRYTGMEYTKFPLTSCIKEELPLDIILHKDCKGTSEALKILENEIETTHIDDLVLVFDESVVHACNNKTEYNYTQKIQFSELILDEQQTIIVPIIKDGQSSNIGVQIRYNPETKVLSIMEETGAVKSVMFNIYPN